MEKHEIITNRDLALQALKQSNVTFKRTEHTPLDMSDVKFSIDRPLDEILWPVITKFPHIEWLIHGKMQQKDQFRVSSLQAFIGGTSVGTISTTYTSSKGHCFYVRSYSIDQERDRGNGMRTSKHDVVISAVRKKFAAKPVNAVIEEAIAQIKRTISNACYRANSKYREACEGLSTAFIDKVHGSADVYEYASTLVGAEEVRKVVDKKLSMSKLEDLHDALSKNSKNVAVVLIDKGGYIVSSETNIAKYTDETLPLEVRKNLGLLKLINEDENIMPDVGVRLNESVFLVLLEPA